MRRRDRWTRFGKPDPVALGRPLHPSLTRGQAARVSFEMRMPMGEHRYLLLPGPDGWLEADVMLPMCTSGDPRWFATVEGSTSDGRAVRARYQLDLVKTGTDG